MGSKGGGGTSTTTQQLDPMLKPYVQYALEQGKSQYQQRVNNYKPYSGQTVAGFTPDTQNYFSGVRNLTAGTAGNQQAQNMTTAAANSVANRPAYQAGNFGLKNLSAEDINAYMNPYTDSVVKAQMDSMGQRAGEQAAALRTRQAGSGALGGSRAAIESVLQDREANQLMAQTEAQLRAQGYDAATATALAQQERQMQAKRDQESANQFAENDAMARSQFGLNAAQNLSQLAQQQRDMETQRLDALRGIGTQQQLLSQAQLDDQYKRYLEQRDWNKNQLADYAAIAYGAPAGSQTTSTQPYNPWSTIGGLAMYGIGSIPGI